MVSRKYKINDDLISCVDQNLCFYENDLQLAITIYILIAKKFFYSPKYACLSDMKEFRNVSDITLDNNEVICTQWSKIYCSLLKKYGIESKVVFDKQGHCFVSFVVDGLTYLADASRYGGDLFNYKLSDFSNVQFGLELNGLSMFLFDYSVGYDVMKSRFDFFVNQIDIVRKRLYSKLGMDDVFKKVSDYVSKKFKCYSFRDMDFDCLIERIPFLNYFLRMNIAGGSIEKHQLLRKVVGILFKDVRDLELFVVPLYDKYDNFKVYSILCFGYKNEFVYYMQDDYGLEFVDKDFLLDKIQSRGLIFGKYRYLPGFYLTTSNSFILKKTH